MRKENALKACNSKFLQFWNVRKASILFDFVLLQIQDASRLFLLGLARKLGKDLAWVFLHCGDLEEPINVLVLGEKDSLEEYGNFGFWGGVRDLNT